MGNSNQILILNQMSNLSQILLLFLNYCRKKRLKLTLLLPLHYESFSVSFFLYTNINYLYKYLKAVKFLNLDYIYKYYILNY